MNLCIISEKCHRSTLKNADLCRLIDVLLFSPQKWMVLSCGNVSCAINKNCVVFETRCTSHTLMNSDDFYMSPTTTC